MPMRLAVAMVAALGGFAMQFAVVVADAVGGGGQGGGLAPIISGGGAATAVGGIVYIARLMATGRLVAREPAEVERQLLVAVNKVTEVAQNGQTREDTYVELLKMGWQLPAHLNPPGHAPS